MKRKILIWSAAILTVLVVGTLVGRRLAASRDAAALQEQMRLARAVGLPTNAAEFAATIKPALPAENAAPFYRKLRPELKPLADSEGVYVALLSQPSDKTLAAAIKYVKRAKTALELVDQATSRPRCWFDRQWSEGAATLYPEFTDMKSAARLVALRGSVAAANGDSVSALNNARQIFIIARHIGEEGNGISAMMSESIYSLGLRELADWSVLHTNVAAYRDALAVALKASPQPDLRRENRDQLWMLLSVIDLSMTKQGRQKLGLKEGDLSGSDTFMSSFLSQPKARIAIVRAERDYWTALKLPEDQMITAVEDATKRRDAAMLAFPVVSRLYIDLVVSGEDSGLDRVKNWRAAQIEFSAVLRAISTGSIARTIKVDDLRSPFDDSPLTYTYDGKQMVISVGRGSGSSQRQLKIPPDVPKRHP